jgi:hypothetical protein
MSSWITGARAPHRNRNATRSTTFTGASATARLSVGASDRGRSATPPRARTLGTVAVRGALGASPLAERRGARPGAVAEGDTRRDRSAAAIALAGLGGKRGRREALDAVFDEHCLTPYLPNGVLETIEQVLERRLAAGPSSG